MEPKNCFSVTSQRQGSIFTEIHYFPTQIPVNSLQLRQALLMGAALCVHLREMSVL